MALDEPTDKDTRLDIDGIPVIVSQDEAGYMGAGGGLRVHYITGRMGAGFTVSRSSAYDFGC